MGDKRVDLRQEKLFKNIYPAPHFVISKHVT